MITDMSVKTVEQLCLACGLCCDGTLFDHVQLKPNDDAAKLKALGLPAAATRAKIPVIRFTQPCAALCADCTCRLYADRPKQCREFECGVYKDVQAGRISFATALVLVKKARRQAAGIRRLLRALGDVEEHRPLAERFRRTQRRMESTVTDEAANHKFAELGLAVHRLNLLAHDRFHMRADTP